MIDRNIIQEKLSEIQSNMAAAANKSGRNPQNIRLMAVTKTKPAEVIQTLIDLGVKDIGENYPDETIEKKYAFDSAPEDVSLHMIGHCQSRKVKIIADLFDTFQSLDRVDIGIKLNRELLKRQKKMPVFLEMNTGEEISKNGWILKGEHIPDIFLRDLDQLQSYSQLEINGLMTLPPFTEDGEDNRRYFAAMQNVMNKLNTRYGTKMKELSMGYQYRLPGRNRRRSNLYTNWNFIGWSEEIDYIK